MIKKTHENRIQEICIKLEAVGRDIRLATHALSTANKREKQLYTELKRTIADYTAPAKTSNPTAKNKLDIDKVATIRAEIARGVTHKEIAKKYDISTSYVSNIRTRRVWGNVA